MHPSIHVCGTHSGVLFESLILMCTAAHDVTDSPQKFLLSQEAHQQQLSQRGADDVSIPTFVSNENNVFHGDKPSSMAEICSRGGGGTL